MVITKQEIIKSVAVVWIIASAIYIGWDTWNDYKIKGVQQAYQAGISDAMKQIFDKSQSNQCKQSLELNVGPDKLELIDVKCLPQSQPEAPQTTPVK